MSGEYMTMSIASLGDATLPKPEPKRFQVKAINDISDIDGARTGPKYPHFYNKTQPSQSDVPGSTSKALTWSRNVRDNSLYIDDIEGTRHTIKDRMMQTKRHVNPLTPDYPLPSFQSAEHPVPKFIKDPLHHDDIDGSTIKPKKQFATRDILAVDDIEGARPNWKPRHAKARLSSDPPPASTLNADDISAPKHRFKDRTSRTVDPNNPVYYINGMSHADDVYTKPKPSKALIKDNHLLQTRDIPGATPGWQPTYNFDRKEFRNTNYIGDIEGTHADSIKHSITTKRESNPLNPVYQSLDPGEILEPLIPPLIPADLIKVPTVPVLKGAHKEPKELATGSTGARVAGGAHEADRGSSDKPPTGRPQFRLELGNTGQEVSRGEGLGGDGGYGPQATGALQKSPYASSRQTDSGRRITAAAAASALNSSGGSARLRGGGTGSSAAPSPGASARSARSTTNPAERRAQLELSSDIDAVRQLK